MNLSPVHCGIRASADAQGLHVGHHLQPITDFVALHLSTSIDNFIKWCCCAEPVPNQLHMAIQGNLNATQRRHLLISTYSQDFRFHDCAGASKRVADTYQALAATLGSKVLTQLCGKHTGVWRTCMMCL